MVVAHVLMATRMLSPPVNLSPSAPARLGVNFFGARFLVPLRGRFGAASRASLGVPLTLHAARRLVCLAVAPGGRRSAERVAVERWGMPFIRTPPRGPLRGFAISDRITPLPAALRHVRAPPTPHTPHAPLGALGARPMLSRPVRVSAHRSGDHQTGQSWGDIGTGNGTGQRPDFPIARARLSRPVCPVIRDTSAVKRDIHAGLRRSMTWPCAISIRPALTALSRARW
jgi:hypothetical protein